MQFWFSLSLALCYGWSVDGPTCRRRISVLGRITPVREDKAEQHAAVLLCHPHSSLAFFPLLCRTLAPPSILLPSSLRPNPNPISFRGEPGVSGGGESRRGWRRRLEVVATETNPNLASTRGDGGTLMVGSSGLAPPCASTAPAAMEDNGSRYPFCILRLHVVNTVGD